MWPCCTPIFCYPPNMDNCCDRKTVAPNWSSVFAEDETKDSDEKLTKCLKKKAKQTGVLVMADQCLTAIPCGVYALNDRDDENVTLESLCVPEDEAWWNQKPIKCLDFSSNKITSVSCKIRFLDTLTTLTLHDNNLTFIPKEIQFCTKLTRVNFARNCLKCLPTEFFNLKELRYLNLSYNNFEELDGEVCNLIDLEILDISFNRIACIPPGIGFMSKLVEVYASNNCLSDIPVDITSLAKLEQLDVMNNNISCLPVGFQTNKSLKCLYIKNNRIMTFPDVAGCHCLVELHAGCNCIDCIPKDICLKLPHLKFLDLCCNAIKEIPDEICCLRSLQRLDVSNNNLDDLPNSLTQLPNLINLQVEGNPIKKIRMDVLQRGTTRILKALRDRCPQPSYCEMPECPQLPMPSPGFVFPDNSVPESCSPFSRDGCSSKIALKETVQKESPKQSCPAEECIIDPPDYAKDFMGKASYNPSCFRLNASNYKCSDGASGITEYNYVSLSRESLFCLCPKCCCANKK